MSKKEGRYYVEYIGWKETNGLYGREFTEPVVRELLARRRQSGDLPRMTIKVNKNEIQISQEVSSKSGSKPQKVKYPAMPAKDVSFVVQSPYPDNDTAACIFLGYNPYTKCATHVHTYRFDSEDTASVFVKHMTSIVNTPAYKERILAIEKDLGDLGHVSIRRQRQSESSDYNNSGGSDGLSYGTPSPHSSDGLSPKYPTMEEALRQRPDIHITKTAVPEPDKKVKRIFSSLQEELEHKLNLEEAPLLLPPKDYDTIVRRHGHLSIRDQVKSKERSIVGPNGIFAHMEAEPYVGAVDEAGSDKSGTSSGTDQQSLNTDEAGSSNGHHQRHLGVSSGVVRSQSDTQANLGKHAVKVRRQHSQASSDRGSGYSDDSYAEGMFNLYQGYKPKSRSKTKLQVEEEMVMWSPQFSFGQAGPRPLPSHAEEESDTLARTAPPGFLRRQGLPAQNGHHSHDRRQVKRSSSGRHSQELANGQKYR